MHQVNKIFIYLLRYIYSVGVVTLLLLPAISMADSIMFQADLQRTGVYDDAGPEESPELVWKFDTGSAVFSTPLVHDGVVYFVDLDGGVYAVSQTDGSVIWEKDLGGRPSFQIALNEALLLVGYQFNKGDGGYLLALDRLSGEEVWKFESDDSSGMGSPTIYDGSVYLLSSFGYMYSIDLMTGREEWRHAVRDGASLPIIHKGTIYIQGASQLIYALSSEDGSVKWRYVIDSSEESAFSTPTISGCCVYALIKHSEGRSVVKINSKNGEQEALFPVASLSMSSVSLDGDFIFFGDDGEGHAGAHGYMNAMDMESGELIWRFETGGFVRGSASIAGDTVYFGSADEYLYAVDRHSGELKWRYKTEGIVNSTPAIVDGRVYFGSIDGHVYVLE